MRALLDVNVLIALLDAAHVGHARAHQWLADHGAAGWASCPITQNGCIRIMSQPAYPGALAVADVASRLMEAAQHSSHQFWQDDISLLAPGAIAWRHVLGHRQVTDSYLLALAVRHQGCFVTFDARIQLAAVASAQPSSLVVLSG